MPLLMSEDELAPVEAVLDDDGFRSARDGEEVEKPGGAEAPDFVHVETGAHVVWDALTDDAREKHRRFVQLVIASPAGVHLDDSMVEQSNVQGSPVQKDSETQSWSEVEQTELDNDPEDDQRLPGCRPFNYEDLIDLDRDVLDNIGVSLGLDPPRLDKIKLVERIVIAGEIREGMIEKAVQDGAVVRPVRPVDLEALSSAASAGSPPRRTPATTSGRTAAQKLAQAASSAPAAVAPPRSAARRPENAPKEEPSAPERRSHREQRSAASASGAPPPPIGYETRRRMRVLPPVSKLTRAQLLKFVERYKVPLEKDVARYNVEQLRGACYDYDRSLQHRTAMLLEQGGVHDWMCGRCQISNVNFNTECLVCDKRRDGAAPPSASAPSAWRAPTLFPRPHFWAALVWHMVG